ncbi:MAG: hypothetical protein OEU76_01255 [Cyclobacteriaceae bacterium]|nr:hypothetical protein [Cyclobacteriaceae bacterium]
MFLSEINCLKTSITAFTVVLLISSCERAKPVSAPEVFNIDSLIQEQIKYLSNSQASLRKQAEINNEYQDTTFVPADSAAWSKELDIFSEIGRINKPVNQGGYDVIDHQDDPASNLTMRVYTANRPLPIVYFKTFYLDTPLKLRKIEAEYRQENSLSTSNRKLIMEFSDTYNKSILSSYSIEGDQKMFIGDSVRFAINCTIHLK